MTWTAAQTRAQFRAIVALRWHIFRNGLRRKGGGGDLVALLLVVPLFLLIALCLTMVAGAVAYYFTSSGHLERIAWILWAIFIATQLTNINLGQPATTFDPTQLIRFPMNLRTFVLIRLFFGILAPSNVLVGMLSLAVAAGITIAQPALWPYAFVGLSILAATNVLFTRMVFAWVDRWLSTRRAREVFTALIFIVSIGFQWVNATYNLGDHHRHVEVAQLQHRMAAWQRVQPYLTALPPGLTGDSIAHAAHRQAATYAAETVGCALYGLAFLAIFSMRMRTEYRGEALSEAANAVHKPKPQPLHADATAAVASRRNQSPARTQESILPGLFAKEFLYLRRNTGLFYGLVAPLLMVLIFAGKFAGGMHGAAWLFPAALTYALMGVLPVSFNAFGLDGTGTQMYFIAPVSVRDVLLAKNLLNALIGALEVAAIFILTVIISSRPPLMIVLSTLLWAAATMLAGFTVGNYRSIGAPKKIDLRKTAQKQASPLSALLAMGILLGSAAVGWALLLLTQTLALPWLLPLLCLALLAAAALVYWQNLKAMDGYALEHREELFAELGKKA